MRSRSLAPEGWPADQIYHGHDGLLAWHSEWGDSWREGGGWPDLVSLEEFDRGVFITHERVRGVGVASGLPIEMDVFEVAELRDGLIWRLDAFFDRARAFEAAKARGGGAGAHTQSR